MVLVFKLINDDSVVNAIFKAAGYTYGPLLGLFAFGMLSKRAIKDVLVPFICILAPLLTFAIDKNSIAWFNYAVGFELIIINATITAICLLLISKKSAIATSF